MSGNSDTAVAPHEQLHAIVMAVIASHTPRHNGMWSNCSCGASIRRKYWQTHINHCVHPVVKAWIASRGESLEDLSIPG